MAITVTFACGHAVTVENDVKDAPVCPQCGQRRVSKVKAPAPRFTGSCSGPFVKQVQP